MARVVTIVVVLTAFAGVSLADRITPPKPLYTEVRVKTAGDRDQKISGTLIEYDDNSFTLEPLTKL